VEFALLDRQNKNIKVKKMQNNYVYTKVGTDITLRWKKMYGYMPASEQAQYIKKWADFREMCARTLDDVEPAFSREIVNLRFKRK
jgi:hypothetical protein